MPRASRDEAQRHRNEILTAASKLARAHGADKVSVPQAMKAAGMTHGGFYRHFASKEDLIAQACTAAFAERRAAMDALVEQDKDAARDAFLANYLSPVHRDNPDLGCAAAALAMDAAHAEPHDLLRGAYTEGLRDLVEGMATLAPTPGAAEDEDRALVELAAIVGAVLIARATAGNEVSDRILAAVRRHLTKDDHNHQQVASS
jgi:TetR/AcrR family transcriptional regulator, transcriptional repressor for nem operon